MNIDRRVSELIEPTTKTWNRQKLKELFFPKNERIIFKQRSAINRKDSFAWSETKTRVLC